MKGSARGEKSEREESRFGRCASIFFPSRCRLSSLFCLFLSSRFGRALTMSFAAAATTSATPARMRAMFPIPARPRLGAAASNNVGRRRVGGQRPLTAPTMPSRRLHLTMTTAASARSNDSDPLVRAARSAASAAAAAAEKLKLKEKLVKSHGEKEQTDDD